MVTVAVYRLFDSFRTVNVGIFVVLAGVLVWLGSIVIPPSIAAEPLDSTTIDKPEAPSPPPEVWDSTRHEHGRKIYNFRCYFCHGYSGNARTLASSYVIPKPRNFVTTDPQELPRERMLKSITSGVPGSAMVGFYNTLKKEEIELVADFIRWEFMVHRLPNTRYHTKENGWDNHEHFIVAFPFATGEMALDTPDEALTEKQREGKKLFLTTCISCHDRGRVEDEGPIWESRPVSFPRNGVTPSVAGKKLDAISGASVYARHDNPVIITDPTPRERQGETLFQKNCAFCHAADGTGKNWIGQFLEPHPRDLTANKFMDGQTGAILLATLREGIPGTSMPAWKSVLSDEELVSILHYINRAFHPVAELEKHMDISPGITIHGK